MAWTVEQITEEAAKTGKTLTREEAAIWAFCWNESEKTGESPIAIFMKYANEYKAKKNLGKINTDNGSMPKKETWQL
jgi:hypothetical protein